MRSSSSFAKVLIHRDPVDMRRGIFGLCQVVQGAAMGELNERTLFVFTGKRRDSIKVLYFDRTGFAMWSKMLEANKFPWPKKLTEEIVSLSTEHFAWLLEGIDVWKIKPFQAAPFERVG
jgi:transposase